MFGVVLWSSKDDHKAVIWCEDHGDLAFYSGAGENVFDGGGLDAGDLVRFKLSEGRDMRVVTNPQLVAEQHYPGLAESLASKRTPGTPQTAVTEISRREARGNGNVVQFDPHFGTKRKAS
ncbi:hypothetical protein RXV86_03565 [Alisedimentitalea sp. MJ-SS2]|uniref:hypothetical protein n=1 Tax=Aliisedimentitalea sp. MJ-SS2 TaxID=3049795 RepID=UPI002908DBED|nr:hypothetical protein [Alisedimentitalea sp. MJ-SS2]MDU8926455.1 hypothetical protein [Alisedimentitalea sp. MJ-SS2]